jgi:hypothetical protein
MEQARQEFANALPALATRDRMFTAASERVLAAGVMPMAEAQQHAIIRSILLLLAVAVSAVMLIVFANVGGLMLVRVRARRSELAVRASFGARRGQLLRQLIVEGNMLALAGSGLGLCLGYAGAVALSKLRPALPKTAESFVLLRGSDLLDGASFAPDGPCSALRFS